MLKNKTLNTIIAVLLLAIMITSISACKKEGTNKVTDKDTISPISTPAEADKKNEDEERVQPADKLFEKTVSISALLPSHPSFPFQENWYIQNKIEEKTNVKFEIQAVPTTSGAFNEKVNLIIASGKLPDLIFVPSYSVVKNYWDQGAFANILDYSDDTPNFNLFKEKNEMIVSNYMSPDSGLYMFPNDGMNETNRRLFMYRKDVFDQLGLKTPTNDQEFYDVLVALKKEYPNSYPFAFREGLGQFPMIAPSWGTNYPSIGESGTICYLNQEGNWSYGPIEDSFKEMLMYYSKLYKEGLVLPNILTIDTKGWQDIISNDQGFITLDYVSRIDGFNIAMRESNPEWTLAYMEPPAFGSKGIDKMAYSTSGKYGYIPTATSNHIEDIMKFCDWLYTDEARELVSWGENNDVYETVNNKRISKYDTVGDIKQQTGLGTYGFYLAFDFDSHIASFSDEVKDAYEKAVKRDLEEQPSLALTNKENEIMSSVGTSIMDYTAEQVSKFILGDKSFDEWDAYVEQVKALGLEQVIKISEEAYKRR